MSMWTRPRGTTETIIEPIFKVKFETASIEDTIDKKHQQSLSLIAIKIVNYYHADNLPIQQPTPVGYLYLDETTQKLYYSNGKYNNPKYLCDWNDTLSGGLTCQKYQASITNDGDIIFLAMRTRGNPIIYPAGNYANPQVIDFGVNPAPVSGITDSAVNHHYSGNYFVIAEYFNPPVTDDDIYIWKVSKPYSDVASWVKVDTWTQRIYLDGEGPNPTREIAHFHTAQFDFYSGQWVVTTGDLDYQNHILISDDDAETFTTVAGGTKSYRMIGMVFTADGAYWGTDSPSNHYLYKATRVDGVIDFTSLTEITPLTLPTGGLSQQPTYVTCLVREPYGILLLDRAEPRPDHKLDLTFWDFTDEKLYTIGTYNRIIGEDGMENRHGFGNLAVTQYQSVFDDGIVCGATTEENSRRNSIDALGNTPTNRIGNLKISISKS